MKPLYFAITAVGAALLAAFGIYRLTKRKVYRNTNCIDGGVVTRNSGADFPKVIGSREITSFSAVISGFAMYEDAGMISGRVYTLETVKNGDSVRVIADWHDRCGNGDKCVHLCDDDFMTELCELIQKHDLARHNGYYHTVSGLPDMYGARLSVKYASGESITAKDNQHCFIPIDAINDLLKLFCDKTENN